MIFQGQELLEDRWFSDVDPLDWERLETEPGVVQLYADLISLRRNRSGRTAGLQGQHVHVHHVNEEDKVIAFHRWKDGGAGDDTVVVLNFSGERRSNYELGVPAAGEWDVVFDSDAPLYREDFEGSGPETYIAEEHERDGKSAQITVQLAPYSAVILARR